MRAGKAKQEMDTTRYRLDPPPLHRRNDLSAWRAAVENAHSQLEHQYNRRVCLAYETDPCSSNQASVRTHRQSRMQGTVSSHRRLV